MDIQFELVLPKEDHAKIIMDWRNDPDTLAMSFHSQPKVWDRFYQEFLHTYFTTPELPPLFAWVQGERAAFIRFQPVSHPRHLRRNCCEISINVAPKKRGIGIGTTLLKEIQPWVIKQGYEDILAQIKPENIASKRAFEKSGFVYLDSMDKKLEETGKIIQADRYICPLIEASERYPTFIIAEAGSNWCVGSEKENFSQACKMIDSAAEAKCDAIKFQTYRPETLYVRNAGEARYLAKGGIHEDIFGLLSKYSMPYEMIPKLAAYCKTKNLFFMSTPFSEEDFFAINPYVEFHKIASYEISHSTLIRLAAHSGKPTFLSTGASNEEDIEWAVAHYFSNQGQRLTLMQCTAMYPAETKTMHLKAIPYLAKRFGVSVGLSDHSKDPLLAPIAAVALGATVIEKHITLDRNLPGPDQFFSIIPEELKRMVIAIRETEKMLGIAEKQILSEEKELFEFARRGIQATKDVHIGERFKEGQNIGILRPGNQIRGIHPKYLPEIEGKQALRNISEGQGIQRDDYESV